jgi:hypothetical protein
MIQNVTISSAATGMPGYYMITVKAVVTKPFGSANPLAGYPKASLAGGTVFPPSTQAMSPDAGVADGYKADFTGTAGNYTATVTENWTYMAETGEGYLGSTSTPVP